MKLHEVQNFFGILGHFLLIAGIMSSVLQLKRRAPLLRWAVLFGCFGATFVSIGGMSVAVYTRGLIGDLSITTQILLACTVSGHLFDRDVFSDSDRKAVLIATAVAGLVLYPMALGIAPIDPYSLGFNSLGLIMVLALLYIWGWRTRRRAAVFIPVGLIAFQIGVLESTNLWDYLVDPLVTVYSWVWIAMEIARKRWMVVSRA